MSYANRHKPTPVAGMASNPQEKIKQLEAQIERLKGTIAGLEAILAKSLETNLIPTELRAQMEQALKGYILSPVEGESNHAHTDVPAQTD